MTDDQARREIKRTEEPWRPTLRQIIGAAVVLVVVIFAVVNFEEVPVDFLFTDNVKIPLFAVMALFGALGFGAGMLFQRHRAKRKTD